MMRRAMHANAGGLLKTAFGLATPASAAAATSLRLACLGTQRATMHLAPFTKLQDSSAARPPDDSRFEAVRTKVLESFGVVDREKLHPVVSQHIDTLYEALKAGTPPRALMLMLSHMVLQLMHANVPLETLRKVDTAKVAEAVTVTFHAAPRTLAHHPLTKNLKFTEGVSMDVIVPATFTLDQSRLLRPPALATTTASSLSQDISDNAKQVHVVAGPSGAGKTCNALAAAREAGAVAIYMCNSAQFTDGQQLQGRPSKEERDAWLIQRNAAVVKRLRETVAELFAGDNSVFKNKPALDCNNKPRPVWLIFDEMGPCPDFVRGLCRTVDQLTDALTNEFFADGPTAPEVRIVVVGTGVEGASLRPGSKPHTYRLHWVRPALLVELEASFKNVLTPEQFRVLRESYLPTMVNARAVMRNARAAIAVYGALKVLNAQAGLGAPEAIIDAAVTMGTLKFKSMNGLSGLKLSEYTQAMLEALAAQMVRTVPPETRHMLAVSYGILSDHAICVEQSTDAAGYTVIDEDEALYLPKSRHGVRFEVDAAQAALWRALSRIGVQPSSGEGFERSCADFYAVAVGVALRLQTRGKDYEPLSKLAKAVNPSQHAVAHAPWELVDLILGQGAFATADGGGTNRADLTQGAVVYHSSARIALCDPGKKTDALPVENENRHGVHLPRTREAFVKALGKLVEGIAGSGTLPDNWILVNAPLSSFADLIVKLSNGMVLLVQCKRYLTGGITKAIVEKELRKLGEEYGNVDGKKLLGNNVRMVFMSYSKNKPSDDIAHHPFVHYFHAPAVDYFTDGTSEAAQTKHSAQTVLQTYFPVVIEQPSARVANVVDAMASPPTPN